MYVCHSFMNVWHCFQDDRIIYEPRKRNQTKRFGNDDGKLEISDLESSSDDESSRKSTRRSKRMKGRRRDSDDEWDEGADDDTYSRSDCFKVEKNLLHYG